MFGTESRVPSGEEPSVRPKWGGLTPLRAIPGFDVDQEGRESLTQLGLLAAQVAMAAARARDGDPLDDLDLKALNWGAHTFRRLASRIRYLQGDGEAPPPGPALFAAGVTNEVVFAKRDDIHAQDMVDAYEQIAQNLDLLASGKAERKTAAQEYERFLAVGERAQAEAGSTGHDIFAPNLPSL